MTTEELVERVRTPGENFGDEALRQAALMTLAERVERYRSALEEIETGSHNISYDNFARKIARAALGGDVT